MWPQALPLDKRGLSCPTLLVVTMLPGRDALSCSSLFSFGQDWADTFLSQNAHISCFPWWWSSSLLSDSYQGQLGILNWITLTRKKAGGILFQHRLASEMPVSIFLPSVYFSLLAFCRIVHCPHLSSASCRHWPRFLEAESFTEWITSNKPVSHPKRKTEAIHITLLTFLLPRGIGQKYLSTTAFWFLSVMACTVYLRNCYFSDDGVSAQDSVSCESQSLRTVQKWNFWSAVM